jgi:hypothetical protein
MKRSDKLPGTFSGSLPYFRALPHVVVPHKHAHLVAYGRPRGRRGLGRRGLRRPENRTHASGPVEEQGRGRGLDAPLT